MNKKKSHSHQCYVSHKYAGPKKNLKRSRGILKHHYGPHVKTRADAWGPKIEDNASTVRMPLATVDNVVTERIATSQTDNNVATERTTVLATDDSIATERIAILATDPSSHPTGKIKTYKAAHSKEKVIPTVSTETCPSTGKKMKLNWPPPDPAVEAHQLIFATGLERDFGDLGGYRVVDIRHVLGWALSLQTDHSKVCTCSRIEYITETADGMSSHFTFKCNMCSKVWYLGTDPKNQMNKCFVWGALTSGSHFAQASQIIASMDVPTMTADRFRKIETELGTIWEEQLWEEMSKAAKLERDAAIAQGHVCSDGIPYIMVYVDGGWCKRSYGHNFNATSGIACIIGAHTKKCLFIGVRNKYCCMCAYNTRATNKDHLCFRNYEGSSSGMEANILVEGFSKSVEMHGLRYTSFVGDGDSSVFARLKEKVPYGNLIKKMECKNHVLKNYTSSLYKIHGDTKHIKLQSRKILKAKLTRLTTVARLNITQKTAEKIRKDVKNGLHHVFGDHQKCDSYYCKWIQAEKKGEALEPDENLVPIMKDDILAWAALETAADNICRKADRLIANTTNNVAENFMSQMAKFTCGKRIHLSRKGSYQRRAHIAGLCQIRGQAWQTAAMKTALKKSPGPNFKKYVERQVKSAAMRSKVIRKRLFTKPNEKLCSGGDKEYGPRADDPPPELSAKDLESQCQMKLDELQIESQEKIDEIQVQTVGQHGNALYDLLRKDRLTASQFGMICKRRQGTDAQNHVKAILYKSDFTNNDTKYGQAMERVAIRLFEEERKKTVVPAGLFIDRDRGYLGASPDGIVAGENALVEVKTFPSLARSGQTLEEAATCKKSFCLRLNENGKVSLKKNDNFYYQIQGQLHVTKMEKCYLILYISSTQPITVLEFDRDSTFIQTMLPKLENFYKSFVLPEIILRKIPNNKK